MFLMRQMNKNKVIDGIELELLSTFFDYVIPFLNKKINSSILQKEKNPKIINLETIVSGTKPKIDFEDVKELESLLLKNLSENVESSISKRIESGNMFSSFNLTRSKNESKSVNYSVLIRYEENRKEEKLSISIKKSDKEVYSADVTNKKDVVSKIVPYSISISYEDKYNEERLLISYKQHLKNYMQQHIKSKEDMTERVPLKWLNILPETQMGGVLGFTYIGDSSMGRRADLTGKTARMVDIHESIHTPDEYETRVLTDWIMEKPKSRYIK